MKRNWKHRTKVYKQGIASWRWDCCICRWVRKPNEYAELTDAFQAAEIHTSLGGYRLTE